MNCCYIYYIDGGTCTYLSANTALVAQNVRIVPFVNQSLTSFSFGAVSTSFCTFINRSLLNLSYGAVSTSLCTFVNSSLMNLIYSTI